MLFVCLKVAQRQVFGLQRDSSAAVSMSRTKTRVLRMLVVVCVVFALSWLPLYSLHLILMFADPTIISQAERDLMKNYALPIAQWLGAANSCINPFIYCYFSPAFRRGIQQGAPPSGTCCRSQAKQIVGLLLGFR